MYIRSPLLLDARDKEKVARVLGRRVRESQLQDAIIEMATVFHWRVAHFLATPDKHGVWRTHMLGDPGWPDLALVRHGRLGELRLPEALGQDALKRRGDG